jgi:CRISPR-associated protein Csb1
MIVETQSRTEQLNQLLNDKNVVALTSREYLEPATGKGTTIQPATYADRGYLISAGVAVIDSVQSQANRLEGIFTQPPYSALVPQLTIEQTDGTKNLLEIGHRLADAVVRYSSGNPIVHTAFAKAKAGDFTALAKLNPTALILGVWDSRDTWLKVPRAFSSQIEASGIRGVRDRAAQFVSSATEATKAIAGVTDDEEASTKRSSDKRSAEGFNDIPSFDEKRGGIMADEIVRTSVISVPLLRKGDAALQAYLFGLALVMFTYSMGGDLRSGTLLVSDPNRSATVEVVYRNGRREIVSITHEDALAFAQEAAAALGVGENKTFTLNQSTYQAAQKVLDGRAEKSGKKGKK